MARYIDADVLEKVFKEGVRVYLGRCDIDDVIRNIADQPTADVAEVVRCKDCTEWDKDECECSHWYSFGENDFCSYRIRKE